MKDIGFNESLKEVELPVQKKKKKKKSRTSTELGH